ncbi:MAG: 1,4-beta-glucanase [Thermoprotei archaeon]|nr:MAG: 1,4-beta-glucanase [Thermoprotei archaeon]
MKSQLISTFLMLFAIISLTNPGMMQNYTKYLGNVEKIAEIIEEEIQLSTRKKVLQYPGTSWPYSEIDLDGDGLYEYVIEICPWNIKSAKGKAEMTFYYSSRFLHYNQDLYDIKLIDPSRWVHGYPEIYYGNKPWNRLMALDGEVKLPERADGLSSFYVILNYTIWHEERVPINLAFDSWLVRDKYRFDGVRSGEVEVMIWLYYNNMKPAGRKIDEVVVEINVNGSTVNTRFEVWRTDMGWVYIAYLIKTPIKSGKIILPYSSFIRMSKKYAEVNNYDRLYLQDVEVGTEFGSPYVDSARLEWWIYEFMVHRD